MAAGAIGAHAQGRSPGKPFPIFQDESGIQLGEHWPSSLENALKQARFLIPILTPSYFNSEACRREAALFLDYEAKAGREDLVLPIYLIDAETLENAALRRRDPLARRLHQRQVRGLARDRFPPARRA